MAGYEEGATVYELADLHGINRNTVSAILQRHGVPRRYQSLSPANIQIAVGLYASRTREPAAPSDVVVISADGKGIVMRPEALRDPTAKAATGSKAQLNSGQRQHRKRMATVGAVFDITPKARTAADIISPANPTGHTDGGADTRQ